MGSLEGIVPEWQTGMMGIFSLTKAAPVSKFIHSLVTDFGLQITICTVHSRNFVKTILGQSRPILILSPSEETKIFRGCGKLSSFLLTAKETKIFRGCGKLSLMSFCNAVATSVSSAICEMNIRPSIIRVPLQFAHRLWLLPLALF